jgi:hypothetical protein
MKKIITYIFILFAFTNCTDDDDKANPVVGTWKLVKTGNYGLSYDDGQIKNFSLIIQIKTSLTHFILTLI